MALMTAAIALNATTPTPLLVQGSGSNQFNRIVGSLQDPLPVTITNTSTTIAMTIGGPTAAQCTFPLATGQSISFALYGESEIPYALSASGTPSMAVLVGRQ